MTLLIVCILTFIFLLLVCKIVIEIETTNEPNENTLFDDVIKEKYIINNKNNVFTYTETTTRKKFCRKFFPRKKKYLKHWK